MFDKANVLRAVTVALAFIALYFIVADSAPVCPTEDSCAIEYTNGEWIISEVTP